MATTKTTYTYTFTDNTIADADEVMANFEDIKDFCEKVDEDNMASDSATAMPTQQSVKAFVTTGTIAMSNKTLTSPVINTGVSGTAILDEDNFASNSATKLATQQSIKAYVDTAISEVGGGVASSDLEDYVAKATFNAHTILAATTDDTPVALEVTEQTVVGRITSGNIAALSVAQLQTLLFSAALPENVEITLDAALSADGKHSGFVEAGTAGATLAYGDLCYFAVADSRWELADADSEAKTFGKLGICVLAAANDGSATKMLLWGKVRADTAFPTFTVGAPVFVSATDGDVTNTAPSGAADCIRIVGYGNTGDELFFCPSPDWFEHA